MSRDMQRPYLNHAAPVQKSSQRDYAYIERPKARDEPVHNGADECPRWRKKIHWNHDAIVDNKEEPHTIPNDVSHRVLAHHEPVSFLPLNVLVILFLE
jgi:hypothetical protein